MMGNRIWIARSGVRLSTACAAIWICSAVDLGAGYSDIAGLRVCLRVNHPLWDHKKAVIPPVFLPARRIVRPHGAKSYRPAEQAVYPFAQAIDKKESHVARSGFAGRHAWLLRERDRPQVL